MATIITHKYQNEHFILFIQRNKYQFPNRINIIADEKDHATSISILQLLSEKKEKNQIISKIYFKQNKNEETKKKFCFLTFWNIWSVNLKFSSFSATNAQAIQNKATFSP
jgi:hypothetical protein